MRPTLTEQQYLELCDEIHKASIMYHVFKEPIINDMRYDVLVRDRIEALKDNPKLAEAIPVARSIAKQVLSHGNPAKHDYPMLRLNRKYDLAGLINWLKILPQEATVDIEVRVTGIELDLIYIEGRLHKAITFGDGIVGRDVTLNAYCIKGIPESISSKGRVVIRGTVTSETMLVNTGNEIRPMLGDELKSHVSMTLHKTTIDKKWTDLLFIAHTASFPGSVKSHWDEYRAKLRHRCFYTPKVYGSNIKAGIYEPGHWEEILDKIKERILNSSYLPPFNGLVFKVSEMEYRYELGYTSRFPEWAIAYAPTEGFTNGTCKAT